MFNKRTILIVFNRPVENEWSKRRTSLSIVHHNFRNCLTMQQ